MCACISVFLKLLVLSVKLRAPNQHRYTDQNKSILFDYKTKFDYNQYFLVDFPRAQMVKNLPAMQEIWVQSLGQEDLLEKEMATHSSIFAREIPWTEELDGLQYIKSQRGWHY